MPGEDLSAWQPEVAAADRRGTIGSGRRGSGRRHGDAEIDVPVGGDLAQPGGDGGGKFVGGRRAVECAGGKLLLEVGRSPFRDVSNGVAGTQKFRQFSDGLAFLGRVHRSGTGGLGQNAGGNKAEDNRGDGQPRPPLRQV